METIRRFLRRVPAHHEKLLLALALALLALGGLWLAQSKTRELAEINRLEADVAFIRSQFIRYTPGNLIPYGQALGQATNSISLDLGPPYPLFKSR
jgi:hypothetical protein